MRIVRDGKDLAIVFVYETKEIVLVGRIAEVVPLVVFINDRTTR